MRLSTRLILSLVSGVAVVSLGLALYQAQAERRGSRRELERRARVMAESLEKSATPLVGASSASTLQRLVVQFRDHERLAGVAVYDAQGKPLAATAGVEEMRAAGAGAWQRALQPGGGNEAFFPWNGKSMHLVALPISGEAGPAGTLAIFQDAGYIDAAETALWRRTLAGVVVQTLMIVGATLLFLRWSLRRPLARLEKWLGDLRRGAARRRKTRTFRRKRTSHR